MKVRRGDVVLAEFPYPNGTGSKIRPSLVIQNDVDNGRLRNTVVVQITSTTHRALLPTQVPIDPKTADGSRSGLVFDSVVNCVNLLTVDQNLIRRRLGSLSDSIMRQVRDALIVALALY